MISVHLSAPSGKSTSPTRPWMLQTQL
jgi:hypothetical protein